MGDHAGGPEGPGGARAPATRFNLNLKWRWKFFFAHGKERRVVPDGALRQECNNRDSKTCVLFFLLWLCTPPFFFVRASRSLTDPPYVESRPRSPNFVTSSALSIALLFVYAWWTWMCNISRHMDELRAKRKQENILL